MGFFSGIGKGLRKVGSAVGKGLGVAAPFMSLIPGVGTVAALGAGALGAGLRKVTASKPKAAPPVTAPVQNQNTPFVTDAGARAPRGAPGVTAIPRQAAEPGVNANVVQRAPAAPRRYMAGTSAIEPGNGLRGSRIDVQADTRNADRMAGAADYRQAIGNTDLEGGAAVMPGAGERDPARLRGRREYLDAIGSTDLEAGGAVAPGVSARTAAARARLDGAADSLSSGPDRVAMAKQTLADFNTQLDEQRAEGIKGIGQSAAALGRVGSGMVTGKLADLERRVQSDRSIETNRLVNDLTERDAADRFSKLGAFADLEGRAGSNDRLDAAELRGERAYRDANAEGNLSRRISVADNALRYGDGEGANAVADGFRSRGELRGERNYRDDINAGNLSRRVAVGENAYRAGNDRADEGTADALRRRGQLVDERDYEDGLAREAYGRELTLAELRDRQDANDFARGESLDRIGYDGDPSALQFGAAGRRAAQGAETTAGGAALIGQAARERAYGDDGDPTVLRRRRARVRTDRGSVLDDSRNLG